ncbi:MAG: hypothetical protein KL787_10545 [Taibaiella sp.]|nr:hypothetical protein [Taibaiella sp.]
MISPHNIGAFIKFLYLKKYNASAPNDLIEKWKSVPSSEIDNQLQHLFRHWNMSREEALQLQQQFLQESSGPANVPPVTRNYYPETPAGHYSNHVPQKKRTNVWMIIALLAILILGGLGAYYALRGEKNQEPSRNDGSILNNDTPRQTSEQKPSEIKVDTSDVATPKSNTDTTGAGKPSETDFASVEQEKEDRMDRVYKLIYAEEDQDLDKILSAFDPAISQYWDLKSPTRAQLTNRYMDSWKKTDDAIHKNVRIVRISKDTYDMYATFSYYSPKDKVYKDVPVHTRYIFNNNGKIVKTYGVK